MDRNSMLVAADAIFAARCAGDLSAMTPYFAEGATFEFAGDASLIEGYPAPGTADALTAVGRLIDMISLSDRKVLAALVEGNRLALLHSFTAAFASNPPFDTVLYDLIEFDSETRVTRYIQFADTARVVSELALLAAPE